MFFINPISLLIGNLQVKTVMAVKPQALILLMVFVVVVQSLSSKRAVLNIRGNTYQDLDGQYNDGEIESKESNGDNKEDSVGLDHSVNSKLALDNEYVRLIKTRIDERFKGYEAKITNKMYSIIQEMFNNNNINKETILQTISDAEKRKNNIANRINGNIENKILSKTNNKDPSRISIEDNFEENNNYEEYKSFREEELHNRNGDNPFDDGDIDKAKYAEEYESEVKEENRDEHENNGLNKEDNEDFTDELDEYDDDLAPFDRNHEDRKDEEFGVFDYLAASKDSSETNGNSFLYKDIGEVRDDGEFVPDYYFDNSDYEV